jgi:hypothetical protein
LATNTVTPFRKTVRPSSSGRLRRGTPTLVVWAAVIGVVIALLLGATVLMATIAFGGQRYFEYQVEEARKISQ